MINLFPFLDFCGIWCWIRSSERALKRNDWTFGSKTTRECFKARRASKMTLTWPIEALNHHLKENAEPEPERQTTLKTRTRTSTTAKEPEASKTDQEPKREPRSIQNHAWATWDQENQNLSFFYHFWWTVNNEMWVKWVLFNSYESKFITVREFP